MSECSITVVLNKRLWPTHGDEDIVEAIIVVIADGNGHAEHFDGEARFLRNVGGNIPS